MSVVAVALVVTAVCTIAATRHGDLTVIHLTWISLFNGVGAAVAALCLLMEKQERRALTLLFACEIAYCVAHCLTGRCALSMDTWIHHIASVVGCIASLGLHLEPRPLLCMYVSVAASGSFLAFLNSMKRDDQVKRRTFHQICFPVLLLGRVIIPIIAVWRLIQRHHKLFSPFVADRPGRLILPRDLFIISFLALILLNLLAAQHSYVNST